MIRFMTRILSMYHVIRSIPHPFEVKFQGFPRIVTFSSLLPPHEYRCVVRDSHGPWFMFYVYGFDLSDRIGLGYIVMSLIVDSLFGCVFTVILHFERSTCLLSIIVIVRHFFPDSRDESRLFVFVCNKIINHQKGWEQ
jgi:hypothetical protein